MGYYIQTTNSTAVLPAEHKDEAYRRMCALNERDDLKSGGSYGANGKTESWFSWMSPNYPAECKDALAIFKALGFDSYENPDGTVEIGWYDSKMGDEKVFFEAIGDLLTGEIEWRGEEGDLWKWSFGPEGMKESAGTVVYIDY